MAYLASR